MNFGRKPNEEEASYKCCMPSKKNKGRTDRTESWTYFKISPYFRCLEKYLSTIIRGNDRKQTLDRPMRAEQVQGFS